MVVRRRGGRYSVSTLLLIAAIVVLLLAAFGVDVGDDVSLMPLGLALFAAAFVF